MLSQGAVNAW